MHYMENFFTPPVVLLTADLAVAFKALFLRLGQLMALSVVLVGLSWLPSYCLHSRRPSPS